MTFSEFAQMLYPIIGGDSQAEFVSTLLTQITVDFETTEEADKNTWNINTLGEYFTGDRRPMSASFAREILHRLDVVRFNDYLLKFPQDVIMRIGNALINNGIMLPDNANNNPNIIVDKCTKLYISILDDCAKKKRRKNSNKPIKIEGHEGLASDIENIGRLLPLINKIIESMINLYYKNLIPLSVIDDMEKLYSTVSGIVFKKDISIGVITNFYKCHEVFANYLRIYTVKVSPFLDDIPVHCTLNIFKSEPNDEEEGLYIDIINSQSAYIASIRGIIQLDRNLRHFAESIKVHTE